jgi:O-succinylbenzoate synthase
MKAEFKKHILKFIQPGGTSRGVLMEKPSWILKISNEIHSGFGEVSIIPNLSIDKTEEIESKLELVCKDLEEGKTNFSDLIHDFPAIHFAIEQAQLDFKYGGTGKLFSNNFSSGLSGIKMNGLIWMNPIDIMKEEGTKKIASGFNCLKFKIGNYSFDEEFAMLQFFRNKFGDDLEIRVDANGAYHEKNVFQVMQKLAELKIHSIEQPIKPGQFSLMRKICSECETPVALDEELIGVKINEMDNLLNEINPDYLILKPSLLGGVQISDTWITRALEKNINWWATSALESNIGLNAIAQWVSEYELKLPQGLGTGSLYRNNFPYGLEVKKDSLWFNPNYKREIHLF